MTLQDLLLHRLTALQMRPVDLRRRLLTLNVVVSRQAIHSWLRGGGISDRHKPAVAEVLGIELRELVLASLSNEEAA